MVWLALVTFEEVPGWFVVLDLGMKGIDQSCCQYLCQSLATKLFGKEVVLFSRRPDDLDDLHCLLWISGRHQELPFWFHKR